MFLHYRVGCWAWVAKMIWVRSLAVKVYGHVFEYEKELNKRKLRKNIYHACEHISSSSLLQLQHHHRIKRKLCNTLSLQRYSLLFLYTSLKNAYQNYIIKLTFHIEWIRELSSEPGMMEHSSIKIRQSSSSSSCSQYYCRFSYPAGWMLNTQ